MLPRQADVVMRTTMQDILEAARGDPRLLAATTPHGRSVCGGCNCGLYVERFFSTSQPGLTHLRTGVVGQVAHALYFSPGVWKDIIVLLL